MRQKFVMYQFQFSSSVRHAVYVFTILCACLLVPLYASASPAYTVTPLVVDVEAEARDIFERTITITNTGDAPVTLYPTVNNISIDDGGTIQQFYTPVESDRTASLASWIEISRAGINLKIGETRTVTLTLRVNPAPKPGVYHAFVGFGNGGNRDEAEKQIREGRAPGTIVTVTIKEDKNELLKLSHFLINRFITKAENEAAVYTIKNPGDTTLVPTGDVIIYDNRGREVSSLPVNPDKLEIAAGAEQKFTATMPVAGLFGKYKAFLSVEYGDNQIASVQDTAFFYVFPLKKILIVFGTLSLIMIVAAILLHRKYFNDVGDDSDTLVVHVREARSNPCEHDIDLKQK